jgi:hypothetical protein
MSTDENAKVVLEVFRAIGATTAGSSSCWIPTGERFDGEVLGLYQLRGGKLARAQMFYFDTAGLVSFLEKAKKQAPPDP